MAFSNGNNLGKNFNNKHAKQSILTYKPLQQNKEHAKSNNAYKKFHYRQLVDLIVNA